MTMKFRCAFTPFSIGVKFLNVTPQYIPTDPEVKRHSNCVEL